MSDYKISDKSAVSLPDEGRSIYERSTEIIDSLLAGDKGFVDSYSEDEKTVIKRVVHATSDLNYAGSMFFRGDAVKRAIDLIRSKKHQNSPVKIVCDSEMTKAGISRNINKDIPLDVQCYIGLTSDDILERLAHIDSVESSDIFSQLIVATGTKSALSIRLAILKNMPDFIVIGNAPTALFETMKFCKQINYKPVAVIGMPVGFVGAADSKKALSEDDFFSSIGNFGNFGGSPCAASAMNAILSLV